jgi:hypothetical protein
MDTERQKHIEEITKEHELRIRSIRKNKGIESGLSSCIMVSGFMSNFDIIKYGGMAVLCAESVYYGREKYNEKRAYRDMLDLYHSLESFDDFDQDKFD